MSASWTKFAVAALIMSTAVLMAVLTNRRPHVAFIGNSFTYFNDLPRVMESMSGIKQRSCLHGSQSLRSLFFKGNGMKITWKTSRAKVRNSEGTVVHDYGACTIQHLLTGKDDNLTKNNANGYYVDRSRNPCLHGGLYLNYAMTQIPSSPYYTFVVMNDHSQRPLWPTTRQRTLSALKRNYTPLLRQVGATPVFIATHAYESNGRLNMTVPEFTSQIYNGYQDYAALLDSTLDATPRIAPSGLAFLHVWETNYTLWKQLFYTDGFHPSPSGTYLTACVLHTTLFNKMPPKTADVAIWFRKSRRIFFGDHTMFPTPKEDAFLRKVCRKVGLKGILPESFIPYLLDDDWGAGDDWVDGTQRG